MSETGSEMSAKPESRKIGLLSMGITLVGIGTVMLLSQLGWLTPPGYRWLLPAYLIVLGVETLVTRLLLDRKNPQVRLVPAIGSMAITLAVLLFIRLWVFLGTVGLPAKFNLYW